jgi:hypothetical protein
MGGTPMVNYDLILRRVYGKAAWDVRKAAGSSLAFEFGGPRQNAVKDPVVPERRSKNSGRRSGGGGEIRGEWHLCICYCDWKYLSGGEELGNNESDEQKIVEIAEDLEGKGLSAVRTDENGHTHFQFDENRKITVIPNVKDYEGGDSVEQWFFYTPEDKVLVFFADGNLVMMKHKK